jgi:hypothetical protein
MKLSDELARCGCDATNERFCKLVAAWRVFLYPQFTTDEFLARPYEMHDFLNRMKSMFMCDALTQELLAAAILSTEPSPDDIVMSDACLAATAIRDNGEPPSTRPD